MVRAWPRFSPDGQLLIHNGSDTRLWDLSGLDQAAPGAPLPIELILPEGDTPAISAKGEILIGTAELLRGFTLDDERLLEIAASRVTRGFTAEECVRFNTEECADDD